MIDLRDLLVCPVCHSDLPFSNNSVEDSVRCSCCGRSYLLNHSVFNMTPSPLPDEVVKSKWKVWETLQDNGLLSYTKAPEFNLSIGAREDAQAFKTFAQPSGLILDVGCGPQTRPSYLSKAGELVGIDPLVGQQPRGFSFVQGIGEYLPFRDQTFDQILYASSLDHIIDPRRSLREAARCLKPTGHISLWIDGLGSDRSTKQSRWERYLILTKKGFKSLLRHRWLTKMGPLRTLSYVSSVARMRVPEGASDCFHFVHLNLTDVNGWLSELGLIVVRQQEYPEADSVFIRAGKER
jgi:SAM-dependent methyltransferase